MTKRNIETMPNELKPRVLPSRGKPPATGGSWWIDVDRAELNAQAAKRFVTQSFPSHHRAGRRPPVYQSTEEALMNRAPRKV